MNPSIGFVGSSNLTLAGLSAQGELNVDVLDHDACAKLAAWFEERERPPEAPPPEPPEPFAEIVIVPQ
mgnify:CR=1 FL=1